jgi:hypothetical protein
MRDSQLESCSAVGIATDCRLDDLRVGVRVAVESRILTFICIAQIGCGAHTSSYPMGIRDSFPEGKAAGT